MSLLSDTHCFVLNCSSIGFDNSEYNQTRLASEKLERLFALVHISDKIYIPSFYFRASNPQIVYFIGQK